MFLPLYISFLINVTSARVLTEGVILDQKEGILESSIPEQPFVKCLQAIPRSRPPPPVRFPGVQFNSLPTDRRTLLFERLERAPGGQNYCLGLGGVKC